MKGFETTVACYSRGCNKPLFRHPGQDSLNDHFLRLGEVKRFDNYVAVMVEGEYGRWIELEHVGFEMHSWINAFQILHKSMSLGLPYLIMKIELPVQIAFGNEIEVDQHQ